MNTKRFSIIFLTVVFSFIIYNFVVWNLFTKKLLTNNNDMIIGDLVRMGYISDLSYPRKIENNLPIEHIESYNYKNEDIDMITIGDSFSNGGGKGLNSYYQDYISSWINFRVLNLSNYQKETRSYIETAYLLANNGFLKESKVKYLLIESVERKSVERFSRSINSEIIDSQENMANFYKFNTNIEKDNTNLPEISFLNNGNFKILLYNLLYPFSNNAFISKVHRIKIDRDLFSVGEKELLIYKNSLSIIDRNTIKNLTIMNDNMNNLSKLLKSQGVTLIYMPVVNKYDLYHQFIIDKKYTKDPFFDIYKNLKKDYIYIDTKKILLEKILEGKKDIYYIDDTHWTNKASEIIVLKLKKLLEDNN